MAKRLTDTDKWKHRWFREMPLKAKLVFTYLCDQCDSSGIWPADFEQMSFHLGGTIDDSHFGEWFGDKVVKFDTDKYFVTAFFDFQYGDAKDTFNAKKSAITKLQKLGLMDSQGRVIRQSPNSQVSVLDTPSILECSEVESFEEGAGETFNPDFEALYAKYPRKVGKASGIKRLRERGLTEKDFVDLSRAITKYASDCRRLKTDEKYIKHFDSFIGTADKEPWRDFIDEPRPTPAPASVDVASGGSVELNDVRPETLEERRAKLAALGFQIQKPVGAS